jgi:hypothetical protein
MIASLGLAAWGAFAQGYSGFDGLAPGGGGGVFPNNAAGFRFKVGRGERESKNDFPESLILPTFNTLRKQRQIVFGRGVGTRHVRAYDYNEYQHSSGDFCVLSLTEGHEDRVDGRKVSARVFEDNFERGLVFQFRQDGALDFNQIKCHTIARANVGEPPRVIDSRPLADTPAFLKEMGITIVPSGRRIASEDEPGAGKSNSDANSAHAHPPVETLGVE